jgi:hypothetical protein
MKNKPPGQSTCSVVKICNSRDMNYGVGKFTILEDVVTHMQQTPHPSAGSGPPPIISEQLITILD